MPTIIERGDSGESSSAMAMIVAIVALAVIVGFALYAMRVFPFNNVAPAKDGGSININLPNGTTGGDTGGGTTGN